MFVERSTGLLLIPRVTQIGQIAARRVNRRDPRYALRRIRRQDRRGAVDSRVAEPRLRRSDQTARVVETFFLSQHAAERRVAFQEEKRREQRLVALLAWIHQLRNGKNLHRIRLRGCQRAVGGAKIDTYDS